MAYVTHKKIHRTQAKSKGSSWPNSDESKIRELADEARRAGKTRFEFCGETYFICRDGKVRCWDCCPLEQIVDRSDRE